MNGAKIQLSPAEQKLVANAEILLTKNRVIEKTKKLLEDVQQHLEQQAKTFSNPHAFQTAPKISRGENYLGLPYLVLDYPRIFQQTDVLAVRSFFWWGHFFSSTLHLSGRYKQIYLPKLEAAYSTFSNHYIGINADLWQHHFESNNYIPTKELPYEGFKKLLHAHAHLKLSAKLPVEDWSQAENFLIANWKFYLETIF